MLITLSREDQVMIEFDVSDNSRTGELNHHLERLEFWGDLVYVDIPIVGSGGEDISIR
jgi:hypothetical protein